MPFIHVKSLPFGRAFDMASVLEGLTHDFAEGTSIGLEHVTATWEFLPPGHYAVAGKAESRQPDNSHPVLVDVLSPDFNPSEKIEKMLRVIASSISARVKIPIDNIFINHRQARSGMVFDAGEIERW
jgi:phenylpyruvate tautomerase PptA (4-oxalocrotonate tautomerase family)